MIANVNSVQMAASSQSLLAANVSIDRIDSRGDDDLWLLGSNQQATRSVSCLVEPEVGDTVLVVEADATLAILSIITRSAGDALTLSATKDRGLHVKTAFFSLLSERAIDLQALTSIKLSAPLGALHLLADSLMQSVRGSFVSIADTVVNKSKNYQLNADESIITRSQLQSITADKELFMDADRINMG